MSARQTNQALIALTVVAVVTGFIAFGLGTQPGRLVVMAHGALGLAILLLAPWKRTIARRGMARPRAGKTVSAALTVVTLAAIASGIAQVSGALPRLGGLTMMQIHVGTGVTALALVAIHAGQRPVSVHRADLGRRALLRAGGLLGAAGLVYLAAEGAWRLAGLPGGQRRFTGSHEISSISDVPATQWLNDRVPVLNGNAHVVRVGTSRYTIGRLASFGDQITATLDCTGGWHTTQTWSGTSLHRLLEPGAGARSVVVRSVTGYWRRFPVSDARQLLLATHVAGQPLRSGHGAPLRLVAPGRRGFWWVKWVDVVEIDDLPPWWQPPLPTA